MADGMRFLQGTSIAADYVGSECYPRAKVCFGVDGSAVDVSGTDPLPVAIISGGAGGSSGGLTNTELRAVPVPVSGTFWQATQPISGTVSVSGSVAVTGAFYPATQPVSGTFWQATQPVSIASMPTTPVTGTFWQATQPVSIASMPTTPVTGTFWQATQPVSGTVTANINGTAATRDLKDNARSIVNAATAIAGVTAVTTEAMLALNVSRDGANPASVTTIAVTSGKKLRIIGIIAGVISTAAAVISGRVSLRLNPSGAAVATSPILATLCLSQQAAALAQAGDTCVLMLPEAIELSGTMQVGLSQVCSAITGTVWASLIAYEY